MVSSFALPPLGTKFCLMKEKSSPSTAAADYSAFLISVLNFARNYGVACWAVRMHVESYKKNINLYIYTYKSEHQ